MTSRIIITGTNATMPHDSAQSTSTRRYRVCRNCEGAGFELHANNRASCPECSGAGVFVSEKIGGAA